MKEVKIEIKIDVFDDINALPDYASNLMLEAIEARKKAYAPYSNFHVGAALLLTNGKIVVGSNQENASYPSGLCAERTSIYYAGAKYPDSVIKAMAITAASSNEATKNPIPPCGACRQAIAEYEDRQNSSIEIFFMGETGSVARSNSLSNLLPFGFKSSML